MSILSTLTSMKNAIVNQLSSIKTSLNNKNVETAENIVLSDVAGYIDQIHVGNDGDDTSDATAQETHIVEGYTAYARGKKLTGTMPTTSVQIDRNRVTVTAGYLGDEFDQTIGTTKDTATYTPSTVNQDIISPDTYIVGTQTVAGDPNLVSDNIKFGANIFGVTGSFTSDANATGNQIMSGYSAYVKGQKINGSVSTVVPSKEDNVVTVPAGYVAEENVITVGTTIEATTYVPGTSNQTIVADSYLKGDQTILGDSALVGENIRDGRSIFNVSGSFTSDGTASAADIAQGKTAYVKGNKVTGEMTNCTVTVTANQVAITKGYHDEAENIIVGTPVMGGTIYPSASSITYNADSYLTGDLTFAPDPNATAENIRDGVTINGVTGSFTEDATATATDIVIGKIAYVKGSKVTGSMATSTPSVSGNVVTIPKGVIATATTKTVGTAKAAQTYTPGTSNQTINSGYYLTGVQTIKGDSNLVASNIKKGVTLFNITGTYGGSSGGWNVYTSSITLSCASGGYMCDWLDVNDYDNCLRSSNGYMCDTKYSPLILGITGTYSPGWYNQVVGDPFDRYWYKTVSIEGTTFSLVIAAWVPNQPYERSSYSMWRLFIVSGDASSITPAMLKTEQGASAEVSTSSFALNPFDATWGYSHTIETYTNGSVTSTSVGAPIIITK